MNLPDSDNDKQATGLTTEERLLLISSLNNLPLSQLLELEYGLSVPKEILPGLSSPKGVRTSTILEWIEGRTGPGINTLIEILRDHFNLHIRQSDSEGFRHIHSKERLGNTKSDGLERKCDQPLLEVSITFLVVSVKIRIGQLDVNTLKDIANFLREKSGDGSIEIDDLGKGSVKLKISGSSEGLEGLRRLFASGELKKIIGFSVNYAEFTNLPITSNRLNLCWANLRGADLAGFNLGGANLSNADLSNSNLSRAFLSQANLSRANLNGANLSWADLSSATLDKADFRRTNLRGTNFSSAEVKKTKFGENSDLLQPEKESLIIRGAIFEGRSSQFGDLFAGLIRFLRRERLIIISIMIILGLISLIISIFNPKYLLALVAISGAIFPLLNLGEND